MMYPEGHAGLSLLILSPFVLTFGLVDLGSIATCLLIAFLSSLPDIDLRWRRLVRHRSPLTHSLLAGVGFGIGFAVITSWVGYGWGLGFIAGFGGTGLHLVGDIFTYTPIKPLWPFSRRGVALGLFKSSNPFVNKGMMAVGGLAFIAVLLKHVGF